MDTSSTTTSTAGITSTTIIAGTLEVEIDVDKDKLTLQAVETMFREAMATALDLSVDHVKELLVSEIERGQGRRLQSIQTQWYRVSYKVLVPNTMDPNVIVDKANRIAVTGSDESQAFRQFLASVDGVVNVGQIISKIPATVFDNEATAGTPLTQPEQDKDQSPLRALIIGGLAIVMFALCLLTSVILMRFKRSANHRAYGSVDGIMLNVV
jgi:hypothetical protein